MSQNISNYGIAGQPGVIPATYAAPQTYGEQAVYTEPQYLTPGSTDATGFDPVVAPLLTQAQSAPPQTLSAIQSLSAYTTPAAGAPNAAGTPGLVRIATTPLAASAPLYASAPAAVAPAASAPVSPDQGLLSADGSLTVNSDGTVNGTSNGKDIGTADLQDSQSNLIDANSSFAKGFQLSSTYQDGHNKEFNGVVDGHQIKIQHDGDNQLKLWVDGKEVKPGDPSVGPVTFSQGGPGNDGIISINGTDSQTGATINATVTEDVTEDTKKEKGLNGFASWATGSWLIGKPFDNKYWNHNGLTLNINNASDGQGNPLQVGGSIGQVLQQKAAPESS